MKLQFVLCIVFIFGIIYAVTAEEDDSSSDDSLAYSEEMLRICNYMKSIGQIPNRNFLKGTSC